MSFVEAHRDRFSVGLGCQTIGLRASTYDDHRPVGPRTRPSPRAVANAGLAAMHQMESAGRVEGPALQHLPAV